MKQVSDIVKKNKGEDFRIATTQEERDILWQARKEALWSAPILKENSKVMITDVCVPISRLADCLKETEIFIKQSGLLAPYVGHFGDGNFHLFVLIDETNEKEMKAAIELNHKLVSTGLSMEGTCTGEHGVGLGKKKYLPTELGENAVNLMISLKKLLDPNNILNPGKIVTVKPTQDQHEHE